MPTLPKESVKTSSDHIIFTPIVISCITQRIKSSGSAGFSALFWEEAAAGVAFLWSIIF